LPVEHDAYWEDYDDVKDELEYFGVNPMDMKEFFPNVRWYNCPTRKDPMISPEGLAEAWINCFYSGYWQAMLDAGQVLELAIDGKLEGNLILKAGANLIIHDYFNGASSINEQLLKDIEVDSDGIYNDGANRYGIQSCCRFVDSAWDGELEVK
jgi:hypothetical protein